MIINNFFKLRSILSNKQRKTFVIIIFLVFIGMIIEILSVGMLFPALSSFDTQKSNKSFLTNVLKFFGISFDFQKNLNEFITFFVFLYLFKFLYNIYLTWRQMGFAFEIQANLSSRMYSNYLAKSYFFFQNNNTAKLINNTINEINIVTFNGIIQGLMLITEIFICVGIVTLLIIVEPFGSMVVFIVQFASSVVFQIVTKKHVVRWGKRRQEFEENRIFNIQQTFSVIKEIKLSSSEREFITRYKSGNDGSAKIGKLQQTVQNLPRLWLELVTIFSILILIMILFKSGKNLAQIASIIALFGASAFKLLPSVNRILSAIHYLNFSSASIEKVAEELDSESPEFTEVFNNSMKFEKLVFDDVSYSYKENQTVLNHVNLTISKNDKIVIIGQSGSGKTTLINLMLGLLDPSSGKICINNSILSENDKKGFQNLIGYVSQNVVLLDDSLRRNIAFGLPDEKIDDERVKLVIELANLKQVVSTLSHGLDTKLGERGSNLSGGQIQRVGIARALYHNSEILVFDEATSALDSETESDIFKTITEISKNKTMLFITHKENLISNFSTVVGIENGNLTVSYLQ